jgi:hypothetical protein
MWAARAVLDMAGDGLVAELVDEVGLPVPLQAGAGRPRRTWLWNAGKGIGPTAWNAGGPKAAIGAKTSSASSGAPL